jgi:hypothetical protein
MNRVGMCLRGLFVRPRRRRKPSRLTRGQAMILRENLRALLETKKTLKQTQRRAS